MSIWNLRRLLRHAAFAALAFTTAPLSACRDAGDITGSIGEVERPLPSGDVELRAYVDSWASRYDAEPGGKIASINYARGLRAMTRFKEAVAVMQAAAIKAPKDFDVIGAFGKALADNGELIQAKDVLTRAYTNERPNWSVMSVQGSVADQLGDHPSAQEFYRNALLIVPGEPSILSNLGLSYALTKQLSAAEDALRQASASPRADRRVRDNYALILALEGKFKQAEEVSRQDMSPVEAAANIAAIRQMIAQSNAWKDIQAIDAKSKRGKASAPVLAPAADAPTG